MRYSRHSELLSLLFLCLSLLLDYADAIGVSFSTPGAGSTWPAGPITVKWSDAGGSPNMAALATYRLQLIVGGNEPGNSQVIATIGANDSSVANGQVADTLSPDIAQSVENGFYLKMTSTTTDGNVVINYSYRFTLINMKGTTASAILDGANAARGSDDVPAAQYNVITGPTASATSSAGTTATATASSTPTDQSDQDEDDEPELSIGTKVGIGIGVIFAFIGMGSVFAWAVLIYRHKKKRRLERANTFDGTKPAPSAPRAVSHFGKSELPAYPPRSQTSSSTELSPIEVRYEMSGEARPVEAARASIYELDSGWDGWEAASGRKSKSYDPTNVV